MVEEVPAQPDAEAEEGGEQVSSDLAHRYQKVATLLTRLATTARSFLLYDPGNQAIHRFLTTLLDGFVALLRDEGQVAFNVQPFELQFEGQTVYLNRDRERSLAFRLYRDGVRTLSFYDGFDWEELARLLEILSIRYTGVHQREDDMVTMLWKAGFSHLEVAAVEGIVPDEPEVDAQVLSAPAFTYALPDDVDLPRPPLPPPRGPTWVAVPEQSLASLRAEAVPLAVPEDCLAVLRHVRRELADAADPLRFAQVSHLFAEVRDYLLSEDHLEPLKRFLALLWEMTAEEPPAWDPERHRSLFDLLDSCGDRRAVRRLLRSVPAEERKLRPELIDVLDRSCPDPVAAVTDALPQEQSQASRAVARQILEHYGAHRLEALQARFLEASGAAGADLLRAIARVGGESALAFVARQAAHPEAAIQDEALWQLDHMPYSGVVGRALSEAFRHADAGRRARLLDVILRKRDVRLLDVLAGYVEEHGAHLSQDEAARIGRVLGAVGGEASLARWQAWLAPAGRLRNGFAAPLPVVIVASLALSEIPGEAAAEALGGAFDSCDETTQPWILGALAQRQRRSGS